MKFGKQIQANQIPGWSAHYLDYKALKKIISSLVAKRPASEAATFAVGVRPVDIIKHSASAPQSPPWDPHHIGSTPVDDSSIPPILSAYGLDEDRGPDFQAHKAAFFFKLERELEKINAFYLQKEAELKLRLETLLSKRRAAASRVLPDATDDNIHNHVEWMAVEEGFRLLERDLGKLQQFIEMNATGFRKILKKWDKRSKSSTKELYLARQVDVQPVFNRQLISEMSDTVAACLLDITDLSSGLKVERLAVNDLIFSHQLSIEGSAHMGPFRDLESNLRKAVADSDESSIRDVVRYSDTLAVQQGGKTNVTRILWKAIINAPPDLADLILSCVATPFDFQFVDDINGRTCLHEAAIAGILRLVDLCLEKGVQKDKTDVYGRSALHYACINGHSDICGRLLDVNLSPGVVDMDNYSPIVYAILNGSVGCVRALLSHSELRVQPSALDGDLIPLSLASQAGHVDVVLLLLQHGAKSVPNTNGEYPIHLAATAGHVEVCRQLLNLEGWDLPDKYNEWTPLFHAARHGHASCIQVLLEAGARVDHTDEGGNTAVHYAAWYGYQPCVDLLLAVTSSLPTRQQPTVFSGKSPATDSSRMADSDFDLIPSLSLPPPIMPYRVYGHNYLDKTCFVQISIGHYFSRFDETAAHPNSIVQLDNRLTGSQSRDRYVLASPFLKLVMTSARDATSAPYSVSLPLADESEIFAFQIESVDSLQLEFSLCPNFGTKTIGRAIALPFLFNDIENSHPFVLPILDHRLHVIGQISFEVNLITPFQGVKLEVGGAVETYWKSMAVSPPAVVKPAPQLALSNRSVGSAHTSPSNRSIITGGGHALTVSSVTGNFVQVVVQVTRDLHPVVFTDWKLPTGDYDLGVSDVTLSQFEALAQSIGRNLNVADEAGLMSLEWHKILPGSMVSLAKLIAAIPSGLGLSLSLAYPPSRIREKYSLRYRIDLNEFVDAVLRTIYDASTSVEGQYGRRRIIFMSSAPDICASLNWKQPNYPVFFVTQCGKHTANPPGPTTLTIDDANDRRLTSLAAAVEFSKANNLLGICLDAHLLLRVPSLIQGVKDAGLLVGAFGPSMDLRALSTALAGTDNASLDAVMDDGLLTFTDQNFLRELT